MDKPITTVLAIKRLVDEKEELRRLLYRYGDHTLECHRAPTTKCLCGWEAARRRAGVRPRVDD